MSARVEVLPGPGTVIRFGDLTIWAGPGVSGDLLSFLQRSARNVAASPRSGRQVVDHIAGILAARDPEPGAPFAVIGPADGGWLALLHGPVQAWDGARWLAPTPDPGWLSSPVVPQPAVSVGPAGSPSPRLVVDSPYDLGSGMVPGGGVIVLPRPDPPAALGGARPPNPWAAAPAPIPLSPTPAPVSRPDDTTVLGAAAPDTAPAPAPIPQTTPAPETTPALPAAVTPPPPDWRTPPPPVATPPAAAEPEAAPLPKGLLVDLRTAYAASRPPLPMGFLPAPAERPQVFGVRCPRGHFNHPAAPVCPCCRLPIVPGQPQVAGSRPTLGVLLADDGTVYRVERDVLIGADPSLDPGVAGGTIGSLILQSEPGLLAPAHAELRLSNWTLRAVDRGSAAGTFLVAPGTDGWTRLEPYMPADVAPGSHLSLGQRVLTYLSPWP